MLRTNVPVFKLESSTTEQTITHLNGLPIDPITFKVVTDLGLSTVLVYPVDGSAVVALAESSRVHVES